MGQWGKKRRLGQALQRDPTHFLVLMRWVARRLDPTYGLLLALLAVLTISGPAFAGQMTRELLAQRFPAPLIVGERDASLPVWPVFQGGAQNQIVAWLFETTDIAPIPGFSGTPPDLLIELAPDGTFMDVALLSHHEPVFLEGLGPEPLVRFLDQYRGKALGTPLKVGSNINSADKGGSSAVYIDGVTKATASVLIINQSVLASAIKVAKAKLGLGGGASGPPAHARYDIDEVLDWNGLLAAGLVKRLSVSNGEVEKTFAGTVGEGLDAAGLAAPNDPEVELYIADALAPSVGKAILGDRAYQRYHTDLALDGHNALLILSAGRWSPLGENWTPGSVPDRIAVRQGGLPVVVRDLAYDKPLQAKGAPPLEVMLLKIPAQTAFDPASKFEIVPHITREKGAIYPERVARDFSQSVTFPERYYERPATTEVAGEPAWVEAWRGQKVTLAILGAALALLTLGLAFQKRLTAMPRLFVALRLAFLTFTLCFIGWYAQGQLSIVNLIGVMKAAIQTHDFGFLLFDPPTLVLWAFTLASLVFWGRGAFCGWLCPFGAMQELTGEISRLLHIPQLRVPDGADRWLRRLKYLVLVGILGAALHSTASAETAAEVEPFKTAITLNFVRHWPFVAYAFALLVANLFVYKSFCRYLCPLGAALACGGKARQLDWIPRRKDCGSPCKLCTVRCRYGAIDAKGKVDYDECFQCLDCVSIYHDAKTCVPLVLAGRPKGERVPVRIAAKAVAS